MDASQDTEVVHATPTEAFRSLPMCEVRAEVPELDLHRRFQKKEVSVTGRYT